jgi:hypothetical protein
MLVPPAMAGSARAIDDRPGTSRTVFTEPQQFTEAAAHRGSGKIVTQPVQRTRAHTPIATPKPALSTTPSRSRCRRAVSAMSRAIAATTARKIPRVRSSARTESTDPPAYRHAPVAPSTLHGLLGPVADVLLGGLALPQRPSPASELSRRRVVEHVVDQVSCLAGVVVPAWRGNCRMASSVGDGADVRAAAESGTHRVGHEDPACSAGLVACSQPRFRPALSTAGTVRMATAAGRSEDQVFHSHVIHRCRARRRAGGCRVPFR